MIQFPLTHQSHCNGFQIYEICFLTSTHAQKKNPLSIFHLFYKKNKMKQKTKTSPHRSCLLILVSVLGGNNTSWSSNQDVISFFFQPDVSIRKEQKDEIKNVSIYNLTEEHEKIGGYTKNTFIIM